MRKKIETRKKFGRICALVLVGMFVVMTSMSVSADDPDDWTIGGDDLGGGTTQILGTTSPDDLSIIAGGEQGIIIDGTVNPGFVGIGLAPGVLPRNILDVGGGMTVGEGFAGEFPAPPNGMIVEGWVGIGIEEPMEALDVVGNIHASDTLISGNSITIDGTNDKITASSGTINFDNENLVTTGNVGIGTTNPTQKLHVAGNARITGALYDSNNDPGTSGQVLMTTGIGIDWMDLTFVSDGDWDYTTNPPHMFSIPTGNVGIGTMNPMNKLDVAGNMAVGSAYAGTTPAPPNGMLIEGTNGFVFPPTGGVGIGMPVAPIGFPAGQLHVDLPFPAGPGVLLPDTIVEVTRIGVTGAFTPTGMTDYGMTLGIYDEEGYPVIQAFDQIFQDPNVPEAGVPLYINPNPATPSGWAADTILNLNSGHVGIGTASPMEALDVVGNIHASGSLISGNSITIDGTNDKITASSGTINFDNENLVTTGNVGIGTTSPLSNLHIDGNWAGNEGITLTDIATGDPAIRFYSRSSNRWGIISSTGWGEFGIAELDSNWNYIGERLTIWPGGNVGIGTTFPSQRLHVAGNARITGALYDSNNDPGTSGQILQTTGSGIDWVNPSSISDGDWTISGNDMYSAVSGNVGIGTTSPTEKLDVNGRAKISGSSGSGVPILSVTNNGVGSTSHGIRSYSGTGSSSWGVWAKGRGDGGGVAGIGEGWHGVYGECQHDYQDHAAIRGHNSGGGWAGYFTGGKSYFSDNVGIGTTSPSHKLTISETSSDDTLRLIGPDSYGHGARINFGDQDYVYIEEDLDDKLYIYASRTAIMGGNVGIGTTSPSSTLDVNGNIEIGSGNAFYFGDPNTDGSWRITRSGNSLVFQRRESGNWVTKSTMT